MIGGGLFRLPDTALPAIAATSTPPAISVLRVAVSPRKSQTQSGPSRTSARDRRASSAAGGAGGYTAFFRECFIDEVALRHSREPLSYRIAMLGQDALLADVLQRAGRLGAWDGASEGSGQGLACHRMDAFGASGRIAVVAEASAGEGGVRVRRLSAAVNIGRMVNRDIALQQIEGGLIFGLAQALGGATEYAAGLPTHQRLAALGLPTLADCPEIRVELVESAEPPFDPGEIGVPAVAPAVANAFFSATGLRLRRLPLLSAFT